MKVEELPTPPLLAIRAFEAAARLGSFAYAAHELDLSAPAVSQHVQWLEAQTGTRLFVRHPHHVELTVAGRVLAAEAARALAALDTEFVSRSEAELPRLRVTTSPTLSAGWLVPRLGRFNALHAHLAVELDSSPEIQDLATGHFDAAIRSGHGRWPGLHAVRLFPSVFMPLCAPVLRRAAAALDDPAMPMTVPLLGRPDWWRAWYRARGYPQVDLQARLGTCLSAEHLDIAAAVAGQGIAIGSPLLFERELRTGVLVPAHGFVASDGRAFWFATPLARCQVDKVVRFRAWLREEAARSCQAAHAYLSRVVCCPPYPGD